MKIKQNIYSEIKQILDQARENAIRAVNFSMVIAYWEIGKRIVEEDQQGKRRADYGNYLLKKLSLQLTKDFGKGFDERELRKFRQLYQLFSIRDAVRPELTAQKSTTKQNTLSPVLLNTHTHAILRTELSWSHYRLLIRVENSEARIYYMNECADQNWSTRTLERQINSFYFERLLSSKNKKGLINKNKKESEKDKPAILDFVKDPYVLEFLELKPNSELYEKELAVCIQIQNIFTNRKRINCGIKIGTCFN